MKFPSFCIAALLVGNSAAFGFAGTPGMVPKPPARPSSLPSLASPDPDRFTRIEARDRIEGEGYTDVTGLVLDDGGVWRGFARRHGRLVGISIDPRGRIATSM